MYMDHQTMPQTAKLTWRMEIVPDDCSDRPDERCEGYWPSHDENEAGYCPPELFDQNLKDVTARMKLWECGEWGYIGVVAVLDLAIPIGGTSFRLFTLKSAGLWGTESDADEAYLQEIYADEQSNLQAELRSLATVIQENFLA